MMDTKTAIAKLKTIFEEDEVTEYSPDDVVLNDGPVCQSGVFYTKLGPRGDVLWAGDLRELDRASTQVPLLELGQLADITYGHEDEEELQIYFQLGSMGVLTHEICWSYCGRDFETHRPPTSSVTITSLATHRVYHGGDGASLMAALAYGPHTPNVQMAIESQFEKYLFGMQHCPDTQALVMLEKCLRFDAHAGVPRSAMQYALLYLHGSEEVRRIFNRDVVLREALALEGVPALMAECLAYRCYWRGNYGETSKALLDAEGLVIAQAMGEEYAVEHFDFEAINRDRVEEEPDWGGLSLAD